MTDQYRIGELERRMTKLEDEGLKGKLGVLENMLANLQRDLSEVRDEVRWMKRALVSAIFTLLGGMILFLVSIAGGWLH